MAKVIFRDLDHRYFGVNGTEYQSVSSVFKAHKEYFDADKIALKKFLIDSLPKEYIQAKKKFKWDSPEIITYMKQFISEEEIIAGVGALKAAWEVKGNISRVRGTEIHKTVELADIKSGYIWSRLDGRYYKVISPRMDNDNESLADNLYDLEDGYYPELLLFNDEHMIAGQSDGVFLRTGTEGREAYIKDLKTDAEISIVPSFKHPRTGYKKLLNPVHHLNECNLNEYSIKMSFYGYMLEQFGFKVKRLAIENVKFLDNQDIINIIYKDVPYRLDEVKAILAHRM